MDFLNNSSFEVSFFNKIKKEFSASNPIGIGFIFADKHMANETVIRRKFQELSLFSAAIRNSMEEKTLKLAQKLAKEVTIEDDKEEARDGNPLPLKTKLEEKIKGFR